MIMRAVSLVNIGTLYLSKDKVEILTTKQKYFRIFSLEERKKTLTFPLKKCCIKFSRHETVTCPRNVSLDRNAFQQSLLITVHRIAVD